MIKIGVTGQSGFVGSHLYNTIALFANEFESVPFDKDFFTDESKLNAFVAQCDVIVHLAAMNRNQDPQVIYDTNILLVQKLIKSLEVSQSKAHVIFSSSTQENNNNLYGNSKKEGRELMQSWAEKSGGKFTGMVIPNVFGPFGQPNYNSVVATFCYQLANHQTPSIDVDANIKLIYVGELVEFILSEIRNNKGNTQLQVAHSSEIKVSELLKLLQNFKHEYQDKGNIPTLQTNFELNLFNTYRCYMDIKNHFPVKFVQHIDNRGMFMEIIRLGVGGQVSLSTTAPNITRGNHFHTRKIERFAVIKGKALIQLRRIGTNEVLDFYLDGDNPSYVDMPIWYTHNIKNIGEDVLYTNFWINECYDPKDGDTYFENV
ncbi:MAG: NAD-dependent epimerase/dehydratase family protein [Sphingobacteriaceae bacterium]|nr:NAD-dependent epimerase/dehydratase family protein [Sphingobacteriaceae bacterium]